VSINFVDQANAANDYTTPTQFLESAEDDLLQRPGKPGAAPDNER